MSTDYLLGPSGGETPHEYFMRLIDGRDDREDTRPLGLLCDVAAAQAAWRQRIDRVRLERKLRVQAMAIDRSGRLWSQVLERFADQKKADPFWRHALQTQIDTLFSFHLKEADYDYDESHFKNIERLNDARRQAGIELHADRTQ